MTPSKPLIVAVMLGATLPTSAPMAADKAPVATAPTKAVSEAVRVQALLDRAENHLRDAGDQAMASFSRAGEFADGDLYVYVLDMQGNFLASGGSSTTLIGRNVMDLTDSGGRPFMREILDGARTRTSGQVEYRWSNPLRGTNEPKIATYRRVRDHVLVVGYYAPNASFEMAKSLVWRAVHDLKVNGEGAFSHFNSVNGGFVQDDLYVFVIGVEDGLIHANGGQPRVIGRKASELVDINGKHFASEMIAVAKDKGEGEIRYTFRNPVTQRHESKRAYIVRVGKYLVGSGAYLSTAQ
ncbi:MAG: cache domain-containing protein [Proteobacteria bacterium]|nr:cache domain-containing protein [Pseudomonadota bacterium]